MVQIVNPGLGERSGEAVTGERRHHDVESILRIAAVRSRVGERANHFMEIPESPRPSVSQDQRHRIGTLAGLVDKMNRHAVDHSLVVGVSIDLALDLAPVVFSPPVFDQLFQIGRVGAVFPVRIAVVLGKARTRKAILQVRQRGIRNCDREAFFRRHLTTPIEQRYRAER